MNTPPVDALAKYVHIKDPPVHPNGYRVRLLAVALAIACAVAVSAPIRAAEIYVSPSGQDDGSGTAAAPLRTVSAAQRAARKVAATGPVTIVLRAGVYYLPD